MPEREAKEGRDCLPPSAPAAPRIEPHRRGCVYVNHTIIDARSRGASRACVGGWTAARKEKAWRRGEEDGGRAGGWALHMR